MVSPGENSQVEEDQNDERDQSQEDEIFEKEESFNNLVTFFLDTHVSLAPTHVRPSVGPSIRPSVPDTFEFPFYQRLWLLYVKN